MNYDQLSGSTTYTSSQTQIEPSHLRRKISSRICCHYTVPLHENSELAYLGLLLHIFVKIEPIQQADPYRLPTLVLRLSFEESLFLDLQ